MRYIWSPCPSFAAAASLLPQTRSLRAILVARLARLIHHPLPFPLPLLFSRGASLCSARPSTTMDAVNTTARLARLRALMKERKVDVYVIPTDDSHASEYIAACDARRQFICGFNGSAGTAVVTLDKAALATDGRYFNQAARQLDQNWLLLKIGLQDVPSWEEWAADQAAGGKTVAVDPTLIPSSTADRLDEAVRNAGGAGLQAVGENLVDLAWGAARPARPSQPVVLLPESYAGRDTRTKIADLRKELVRRKAYGFVLSSLDEIAWLFNLRGSDIAFNPVFFAYAIVTTDSVTLYTDASRFTPECQSYLAKNNVAVKPYGTLFGDAELLAKQPQVNGSAKLSKKFLISNKASWALKLSLGGEGLVDEIRSPVGDAKAVKTEAELEGMRRCHIRDGVALIEFFAWLENELINKKTNMDEVAAATKLEALRKKQRDYKGLSFTTISATGPNAAVIHYKPEPGFCSIVDPNAVYLCDSGAQYIDGTTDTTRTIHFGTPTVAEKLAYTLVLKGHMALDMAVFPKGTTGYALDVLARQFLWGQGLDYRHGTGHGVGSYLNVHEGPFGIGTRKAYVDVPLAVGNVTSIEPGFYEDGKYGIRLENIALVQEMKTKHVFGDKPYIGFEHVTMVPFCKNLIDSTLLTPVEVAWLNKYHAEVFEKTRDSFKDDALTLAWLTRETLPI